MRRREFIKILSLAAACPNTVLAQQTVHKKRVGMLVAISESDPQAPLRVAAIKNGLRDLGWSDNIQLDIRFTDRGAKELQTYARELLSLKPDVIFAGNTSSLAPLHRETRDVPLVFAQVEDPVANGFVESLAKPGGNITGFTNFEETMPGKWLQLLKEFKPTISRVAFVFDPTNPTGTRALEFLKARERSVGVAITGVPATGWEQLEAKIASVAVEGNAGIVVLGGSATASHRDRIVALAADRRLPAIYPYRYFVASGGLASYGADTLDLYHRAAAYIDRVLRGEKPGHLPVQQPTKFEFVINLKAAAALGIDVPATLVAQADEVIE